MTYKLSGVMVLLVGLTGCTVQETYRAIVPMTVEMPKNAVQKTAVPSTIDVAVGQFINHSHYMKGLFSGNADQLGGQAKTILKMHLQQTRAFNVMDRQNLDQNLQETKLLGKTPTTKGARYLVTGSVTEFGRKDTGEQALFGVLGAKKNQSVYAKVSLNVIDVLTSKIVYSTQGAGEYKMTNQQVLGFGSVASYDSTLSDKVLNLAIIESINALVRGLKNGVWVQQ